MQTACIHVYLQREPGEGKAKNRNQQQTEGLLPPSTPGGPCAPQLRTCCQTGRGPPLQVAGYSAVGNGHSSQRDKVGKEENETGVNESALFLSIPKLLADRHVQARRVQVQVDRVERSRGGQRQRGQPDQHHQAAAELASQSLANGIRYNDITIHRDGHEGQNRCVNGGGLHHGHKVTHVVPEHPTAPVKGVGGRQRDAEDAHHQVDERQVTDEEVSGVVSLFVVPDEEEEEEVPGAGDQNHDRVERDEEELQAEQQVKAGKRGDRKQRGVEEEVGGVTAGG